MASIFGRGDGQAKSWSDLYDEDFEFEAEAQFESEQENGFFPRRDSLDSLESASNGSDTPRLGLSELKNPGMVNNARVRTPDNINLYDDSVSEHTGFIFEEHNESMAVKTPTPMPKLIHKKSSSPKRSGLDRWAALGDRRRQPTLDKSAARMGSTLSPSLLTPSSKRPRTNTSARKNASSWNIWGQGQNNWNISTGSISPETKKQWNMSKDWRKHDALSGAPMDATERGRPLEWVWRI